MIDGAVLPERPDLVDHRQAATPTGDQRGEPIEAGRVRVEDLGLDLADHLQETASQTLDDGQLVEHR